MFDSSESPLHQVLAIPLLVDLICQHLEPRHILPALLSSRAFHVAFLEHRWTTLATCAETKGDNLFPFYPSPELTAALERYGPGFARHLALPYTACCLRQAFVSYSLPFLRLRTIQQFGWQYDEYKDFWMHWDGPPQRIHAHNVDDSPLAFSVHIDDMLSLAVKSRFTLRRLDIASLALETHMSQTINPLTQLIRALPTLENLEILLLGSIHMVRVVDVVLHLPSRLRELHLTPHAPNNLDGDMDDLNNSAGDVDEMFEQAWALYCGYLRSYDQSQAGEGIGLSTNNCNDHSSDGDNDGDSRQERQMPLPFSGPTARSSLESMATMTRLTRFSLTDCTESHPEWIVPAIVCHCPLLNSLGLPLLSGDGMSALVQAIQEERLGQIEHLELPDHQLGTPECIDFFDTLLPSRFEKEKAQSGANYLTPEIQERHKESAGLRSLTLLRCKTADLRDDDEDGEGEDEDEYDDGGDYGGNDDDDDDGGGSTSSSRLSIHFKSVLTKHYPTLERISLVGCEYIQSSQILLLLESCPRLEALILHEPPYSYRKPTCGRKPEVDWIEFAKKNRRQSLVQLACGNPFLDECQCCNGADNDHYDKANTGEHGKGMSYDKDNESERTEPSHSVLMAGVNIPRPEVGSAWPCSQSLRILSLVINIKDEATELERIPHIFANIYRRLGQLVVLEDLSVECNTISIEFDPWSFFSYLVHDGSGHGAREAYNLCLDFTLRQGLGFMDQLKRLRRLNIQTCMPRIGMRDRKWMDDHWPRLEAVQELELKSPGW